MSDKLTLEQVKESIKNQKFKRERGEVYHRAFNHGIAVALNYLDRLESPDDKLRRVRDEICKVIDKSSLPFLHEAISQIIDSHLEPVEQVPEVELSGNWKNNEHDCFLDLWNPADDQLILQVKVESEMISIFQTPSFILRHNELVDIGTIGFFIEKHGRLPRVK